MTRRNHSHDTGHGERIVPGTPSWETSYPDHIQRYQFVAKQMSPGARVLDAACGSGYGAAYLVDQGAGTVVAVDIAAEALDLGRKHFHRDQIVWVQDDCHTLDAAASYGPFDLVCSLETFEHLKEPERFLGRVGELMRPDGILLTSSPNRLLVNKLGFVPHDAPPLNPFHVKEYSADEFETVLRRHFDEVTLWYQCLSLVGRMRMAFEPAIAALWTNPAMRVGRWLQRRIRGRQLAARLEELLPPQFEDLEILEGPPGTDVIWVLLGVCRRPHKA